MEPMVYTRTYTFTYFYSQYSVLFTMVPRNRVITRFYASTRCAALCLLVVVTVVLVPLLLLLLLLLRLL